MATIKVRTSLRDGVCTVRTLIKHPMAIGGRGAKPHFITHVNCKHKGETVMTAHWGGGISKNPYLSFTIAAAAKGDPLVISWLDNDDHGDSVEVTI